MKFSHIRFVNAFLLVILALLGLTGAYALFWTWKPWIFDLHRAAGMLLIAAVPWKAAISWSSLRRRLNNAHEARLTIVISIFLALVSALVVALGFAWYWRIGLIPSWLGQTVIAWHWILGLGLGVPILLHVWQRWLRPRKADFASRRAFLRMALLGSVGLAAWAAGDWLARTRSLPSSPRTFTGSRESGSKLGNFYPVTNNPGEGLGGLNQDSWRLRAVGKDGSFLDYSYTDLLALPANSLEAAVDCTLGWYSRHAWQGVSPFSLLKIDPDQNLSGFGLQLQAISGYTHVIPFPEAGSILLATHVDGQVLAPEHGFPLRAVAPTRRGWFWVKWVNQISLVKMLR